MYIHTHTHTLEYRGINMNEFHKHYINENLKNKIFHLHEVQNIFKPEINCIGILYICDKSVGKKQGNNKYIFDLVVTW